MDDKKISKVEKGSFTSEWIIYFIVTVSVLSVLVLNFYFEKKAFLETKKEQLGQNLEIAHSAFLDRIELTSCALKDVDSQILHLDKENINKYLHHINKLLPFLNHLSIAQKSGNILYSSKKDGILPPDSSLFKSENFLKSNFFFKSSYNDINDKYPLNLIYKLEAKNDLFVIANFNQDNFIKCFDFLFCSDKTNAFLVSPSGFTSILTSPKNGNTEKILTLYQAFYKKHANSLKDSSIFLEKLDIYQKDALVGFLNITIPQINLNGGFTIGAFSSLDDLFLDLDRKNQTVFTLFFIISIIGAYLLFKSHEKRKVLAKLQYELQLREKIRLESLVYIDELTNIANRRFFDVMYKKEFKNSFRNKTSLSIIFCDIDFFKDYNDFYGHQAGDEALKTIAQTLKSSLCRSHDLVARYGGEEFIILLPSTTAKKAKSVALKMRNNVRDLKILHKKSLVSKYITLSYGIASLIPNDEKDFMKLLKNADAALYEAKNSGRDKISIASV